MTIDISSLIANVGDGGRIDPDGLRPDASDVESDSPGLIADVIALTSGRALNSRGRKWITPEDLGAPGSGDEHEYIAWALWLGKFAAEQENGAGATPYSVKLDGRTYRSTGFIEIQNKQQLYGDFTMTVTDNGGNPEDDTLVRSGSTKILYDHTTENRNILWGLQGTPINGSSNTDWFPLIIHYDDAEDIIIENIEIDGNASSLFVGGSLDDVISVGNGYNMTSVLTNLRDTFIGGGISCVNQSGRSLCRNATIDNCWIHNCMGTPLGGIITNPARGILVCGNSVGNRAAYWPGTFVNGLSRLYLYGRNHSSNLRVRGGGGASISALIIDEEGPFGDGWSSSEKPLTTLAQGDPTHLVDFEQWSGSGATKSVKDEQAITVNDFYLNGDAYGTNQVSGIASAVTFVASGRMKNLNRTMQAGSAPRTPAGSSVRREMTWNLTCVAEDCIEPPQITGRGDGVIHMTMTRTTDSLDNYNLDSEGVAVPLADPGIKVTSITQIASNPKSRAKWDVTLITDWLLQTLVRLQIYTSGNDGVRFDPGDLIPLDIALTITCRNNYPMLFSLGNAATIQKPDDPLPNQELKYMPVRVRLQHSGTPGWDVHAAPRFGITADSATRHPEIFHIHDTSGAHNTYRRVYIVSNANKAAANANMQNAGHGANCFSLELTKDAATWWAACLVAGDANKDEFEEPVTAGVAIDAELTVSGTGPSGFRDAIDAAGYALA